MSGDEFPPKVPCPGRCEYGACGVPGGPSRGPYGCGGCCRCLGGCHVEYEIEQMYTPETPQQRESQRQYELLKDIGPMPL